MPIMPEASDVGFRERPTDAVPLGGFRQPDIPAIETLGGLQQPDATQSMPPLTPDANGQPTNNYPDSPEVTPDPRDPRQQAWDNYLGVLQSRPRKEKAWKEAVFLGLQALDKVFSDRPNPEPIRLLRDVQQDKRIAEAGRTLSAVEAKQKAEQDAAWRKAQTQNIYDDNLRQQEELQRKRQKDERDYEIKTKTLDWKKEDRDQYYELEDIKLKAREKRDEETFKRADAKQKELEEYHKALIGERKADRTSREKIAGMSEAGRTRRTQLAIDAKKALTEFQEAQRSGRAADANALREKLAQIKAKADALQ